MKKIYSVFILCFCFLSAHQSHADTLMVVGDSIAYGYYGDNPGSDTGGFIGHLVTAISWSGDTENQGVASRTSTGVANTIVADLATYAPTLVYCHVGINDPGQFITEATTITNFSTILTACNNAGATLYVNQILPHNNNATRNEQGKKLNGRIEQWCADNDVEMCPVRREFSQVSDPDKGVVAYLSSDGIHPTQTGHDKIGDLMGYSGVPAMKRVWGSTTELDFGYQSWKWFLLNGSSSITGDSDTGTLSVPNGDTSDSLVVSFYPNGEDVSISATVASGTPTYYYRVSDSNFARNAADSWTEYTAAFSCSNRYIQIRVSAEDGDTVNISDITLVWGEQEEEASDNGVMYGITTSGVVLQ